jgi:hypothetical protein
MPSLLRSNCEALGTSALNVGFKAYWKFIRLTDHNSIVGIA